MENLSNKALQGYNSMNFHRTGVLNLDEMAGNSSLADAALSVYTENVKFEWNPAKAESNLRKHHLSFELAITVFDDPYALIAPDPKHSKAEQREWIIGESDKGVLVVIFTKRLEGQVYRIISARRANRRERKLYEEFKRLSL